MGRVLSLSPSSPQKSSVILNLVLVKSRFISYDVNMNQVLLYASVILASVSFFLCCYACMRVGKLLNSVKGLEWDTVATLTGDIGTIKKSIQTLNNRINGLNSPKLNDELLQYAMKQQSNVHDIKKNNLGG
jgi:hypothetical protein